ncbi:MAG: pseudaminic acid cytidylyltransferase [Lachnospiraceae bacterium]|nr:pseudaminic acid cytidylyltransferase [Lachnospiraceae bacterium]
MSAIAIMTARGGSKRIPKKNMRSFCGKPILTYGITAALTSGLFDEVMVSTDSEEIAEIARQTGAKVPFMRSARTADDYATTEDVLLEVLDEYKEAGRTFDMVCCIYPTAPFLTASKIKEAFAMLAEHPEADSVVPVVAFSFPPQRALITGDNGYLCYQYPENALVRSQDLMTIYHDCGQFYVCREKALQKYHDLITPRSLPFILPETEVQDIDHLSDWDIAEMKYRLMKEEGSTHVESV